MSESSPTRRRATYDDLCRVPEHFVAEILDGELLVTRMIEAGELVPEDRLELIEGEILAVTRHDGAHAIGVSLLHEKRGETAGFHYCFPGGRNGSAVAAILAGPRSFGHATRSRTVSPLPARGLTSSHANRADFCNVRVKIIDLLTTRDPHATSPFALMILGSRVALISEGPVVEPDPLPVPKLVSFFANRAPMPQVPA